jgi:hypothetical protein
MLNNFDYRGKVFSSFFNKLIQVDNKFFFQFFYFKNFGVRSKFFFSFLRSWVKLLYGTHYNYVSFKRMISDKKLRSKFLYSDFIFPFTGRLFDRRRLDFDYRDSFYPINRQVYIRSNTWSSVFVPGKVKRIVPCIKIKGKFRF